MSSKTKSDMTKASTPSSAKGTSLTDIQARVDQENKQGFRGIEVDSTPNENYTLAGVVKDAPTPETDVETAHKVRVETGLGLSALEAAAREKGGK